MRTLSVEQDLTGRLDLLAVGIDVDTRGQCERPRLAAGHLVLLRARCDRYLIITEPSTSTRAHLVPVLHRAGMSVLFCRSR
jgi:hypothetical protein